MDEKDPKPLLILKSLPTLKISNVYSESKVNNDKSEHQPMQTIRVRTPGQLNGSALEARPQIVKPNSQVIVKRLGNTTIRQTVALKVGAALNAEMKKILIQKSMNQAANTKPLVRATRARSHIDPSQAVPIGRNPPDPRDATIRELKKVLLECRQEVAQVQMKMNRLTIVLNDVLNKMEKTVANKPPLIAQPPQKKLVATKSTGGKKTHEVTYRLPIFPISTLNTLTQFETDLKNRTFFKVVFQKMETVCNSVKIRQEMILPFVFQSILNLDVLSNFVWDHPKSTIKPFQRLQFKNFHMFQSFFVRLSHSVNSSLCYQNIDPKKFEQFLRSKIIAQEKLQLNQDERLKKIVEKEVKAKKELIASINLDYKPKQRTSELLREITTDKRDEKRIEWIEDEEASINQSEMEIENPDDEEHEMESFDGDYPSDNEANLESVLDEHDFEFLDC